VAILVVEEYQLDQRRRPELLDAHR
jgi:hypothetical protein